jgi:hypothetical protein
VVTKPIYRLGIKECLKTPGRSAAKLIAGSTTIIRPLLTCPLETFGRWERLQCISGGGYSGGGPDGM